jgi:hypothetical protein
MGMSVGSKRKFDFQHPLGLQSEGGNFSTRLSRSVPSLITFLNYRVYMLFDTPPKKKCFLRLKLFKT